MRARHGRPAPARDRRTRRFDPAAWLARAQAAGYSINLAPGGAGRPTLGIGSPTGFRASDAADLFEELMAATANEEALREHLEAISTAAPPAA